MALHLPEAIRQNFVVTAGEFILKVYRHNIKERLNSDGQDKHRQMNEQKIVSYMDTVDDVKKEKDHEYICKLISEYFSQKLFDKVNEIYMRKPMED